MKQIVLPADALPGGEVVLGGALHHYLVRVRRVVPGADLSALGPAGQKYHLRVESVLPDSVVLSVQGLVPSQVSDQTPRLYLFSFLLKSGKMDDVIRQAGESGVFQILPIQGDHCVARWDPKEEVRKRARWTEILKEAAQQSGSPGITQLGPVLSSRDLARWWAGRGPLLFFHETPLDKGSLHGYLSDCPTDVGVVVGPEGGLSSEETTGLISAGARPCWLGPTVYRAETASVAALAAVKIVIQEQESWSIRT